MPIHLLRDEVASQIAAGEVVERPASVVKELLENALDAGARHVSVAIEEAGRRLIEVADDGSGIPTEELALAVARHATSKLSSAEDLFHISTLGFRGEALASIGSVSRMSLTSRAAEAPAGARLHVEAGRSRAPELVGAPPGTVARVEELFFNVPARLKFLKKDVTERQAIDALVTRYALAYPEVRFRLTEDGRPVLQTSGNGDRREVLASLYGVEIARQMLDVDFQDEPGSLKGYISPTALTRSNKREITWFVNGRWVQDTALTVALLKAYHTLLMVGRFPMTVLFLQVPPDDIDVNVHPAKAEVRFRHADRIFGLVQRAVRRTLLAYTPIPQVTGGPPAAWISATPSAWTPHSASGQAGLDWQIAAEAQADVSMEEPPRRPEAQPGLPSGDLPLLRPVGQVGGTYLVAEGPDGLYLIDQHAAHERVLFERFMGQRGDHIPSQALLEPATVQLTPQSAQLLAGQLDLLGKLGFQVEAFGPSTFRVRAIPALLAGSDPAAALRVVVEDFEEDETPLQAEVEAKIIARVCKRAAVKAGQNLSVDEQRALLHDLEQCQSPRTCPHGRPTMIHLSVDLLERQFGRRGAR